MQNLRDRITEARAYGWLGEVEGLEISLNAAVAKLANLKKLTPGSRPRLVDLGLPVITDPKTLP